MVFGLHSIGFAIVIGGLTYGVHLLLMPTHWIVVGAVVLLVAGYVCCWPANERPELPDGDCNR